MNKPLINGLTRLYTGKVARSIVLSLVLGSSMLPPSLLAEYIAPDAAPTQTPVISLETAAVETPTLPLEESDVSATTTTFLSTSPLSASSGNEQVSLLSSPAGRSLYVSLTGSDSNQGTETSPWRSLQHAINQLKAGDTLFITAGTYKESANFSVSGTAGNMITIKGIGNVVIDGSSLNYYDPIFETKGHDYLRFENLTVNNARAAVDVNPGSTNIEIDGLKTDGSQFAVKINGGENITVRNAYAINSRNAFRTEGATKNVLFENIETYNSADRWSGYNSSPDYYLNGDGFILEEGTNITLRNIISGNHGDAGFDIKASNVLLENVISFGNKNNFKTWGTNIVIKNSLSYGAKRQSEGTVRWDGNGLNARQGSVTFINTTFADNEDHDVKMTDKATVKVQNSIVANRGLTSGKLLGVYGGNFTQDNVVWYDASKSGPDFTISSTSKWADPLFVDASKKNYRLKSGSPAINFGNNALMTLPKDLDGKTRIVSSKVDAGSYEFQTGTTVPNPVIIGLTSGQQVSGSVTVRPDLTVHPAVTGVDYSMDGKVVKQTTTSPFSYSFDSKLLANGTHTLSGVYKTPAGTIPFSIQFTVSNTAAAPVIIGLSSGQQVNSSVTVRPDLTVHPNVTAVQYSIDGVVKKNTSTSPFSFTFDASLLSVGTHTLSGHYSTPSGNVPFSVPFTVTQIQSTSDIIGLTEGQTVKGWVSVGPNLDKLTDIRKVAYYIDGSFKTRVYSTPFKYSFDASKLSDGDHELKGYYTDAKGDHWFTINFKVGSGTTTPPPVPAPVIIGLTSGQEVTGSVTVRPDLTVHSNVTAVHYSIDGTLVKQATASPFSHTFDASKLTAGSHTLSGVYKTPSGDLPFTINFTVKAATPPPSNQVFLGLTEGQKISAPVTVMPNLELNPDIKKVLYYMNGTKFAQMYSKPFQVVIDPKKLSKGTHTLSGIYTTDSGDKKFSITFTVV